MWRNIWFIHNTALLPRPLSCFPASATAFRHASFFQAQTQLIQQQAIAAAALAAAQANAETRTNNIGALAQNLSGVKFMTGRILSFRFNIGGARTHNLLGVKARVGCSVFLF